MSQYLSRSELVEKKSFHFLQAIDESDEDEDKQIEMKAVIDIEDTIPDDAMELKKLDKLK